MKILACAAIFAAAALAQETPTERDAARDVLHQMAELEKSIDVSGLVERLSAPNAERDKVTARARQLMDTELLAMADDITKPPEIGFEEKRSVGILVDYLRKHNFDVTVGVANLPTAFVARYKGNHGAPNLGVILEYDALRGTQRPFHGDQHSAQGPVGIAAAVAMAEYLERTHAPGSVVVFGTPGEEMMPPVAKTDMFQAGVFNGMDVIVRSHSVSATNRPAPGFGTCCLNIDGVKYTFSGAPAHQMTPWAGRNALEAVIHLFNNIDAARTTHAAGSAHTGRDHRGRGRAQRGARPHRGRFLHPLSGRHLPGAGAGSRGQRGARGGARDRHQGEDRQLRAGAGRDLGGHAFRGGFRPHEAVRRHQHGGGPGKPQGYEETGSVSSAIPGIGFAAQTSTYANHTYEMEADALAEIGHHGFVVDAEGDGRAAFRFATRTPITARR